MFLCALDPLLYFLSWSHYTAYQQDWGIGRQSIIVAAKIGGNIGAMVVLGYYSPSVIACQSPLEGKELLYLYCYSICIANLLTVSKSHIHELISPVRIFLMPTATAETL